MTRHKTLLVVVAAVMAVTGFGETRRPAMTQVQQPGERRPAVPDPGGQQRPVAVVPVLESPFKVTPDAAERRRPVVTDPAGGLSAFEVIEYNTSHRSCFEDERAPQTLADLDGGYSTFYYTLTEDDAIKFTIIPLGSATRNKRSAVSVYRFLQYTERLCEVGGRPTPVIWGVGAQAVLHVRDAKRGVSLSSPTILAAAVEFKRAEVAFSMETVGITGSAVRKVLPEAGAFHVENYGKMISAVDQVRMLLDEPGVTIRPRPLGTRTDLLLPRR